VSSRDRLVDVLDIWTIKETVDQSSCEDDLGSKRQYSVTVTQVGSDVTIMTPGTTLQARRPG
jgi:hypothetical protein